MKTYREDFLLSQLFLSILIYEYASGAEMVSFGVTIFISFLLLLADFRRKVMLSKQLLVSDIDFEGLNNDR